MHKYIYIFLLFFSSPAFSQTESFMPVELIAEPGEQKTNNLSTGTSASLRVGTSSTFGSNASVSSSTGFVINSNSKLIPESADFSSSFGSSLNDGISKDGMISVDVSNIKFSGAGTKTDDSIEINAEDYDSASGIANVTGISSLTSLKVNPLESETLVNITDKEGESEILETANGSANQNMSNSLNVDITNNNFSNAFSQSF